jgi:hypothetical protein
MFQKTGLRFNKSDIFSKKYRFLSMLHKNAMDTQKLKKIH